MYCQLQAGVAEAYAVLVVYITILIMIASLSESFGATQRVAKNVLDIQYIHFIQSVYTVCTLNME
jgi:hypothetical protein